MQCARQVEYPPIGAFIIERSLVADLIRKQIPITTTAAQVEFHAAQIGQRAEHPVGGAFDKTSIEQLMTGNKLYSRGKLANIIKGIGLYWFGNPGPAGTGPFASIFKILQQICQMLIDCKVKKTAPLIIVRVVIAKKKRLYSTYLNCL